MDEKQFGEIEKALLFVSESRKRVQRASKTIAAAGADQHLVDALDELESNLAELHRTTMQKTYFAVPDDDALFASSVGKQTD